MGSIKRIYIAL